MANPVHDTVLTLCIILFIGTVIGRISLGGFSLGSLGVLFTALLFGYSGYQVDEVVFEIGLLLFVYAVGLQAGPRFFRTIRKSGTKILLIAIVPVLVSLLSVIGVMVLFDFTPEVAVGIFSGALTNTSSLAAAIDAMASGTTSGRAEASLGYGIVYPFAMLVVVLAMQLVPRVLGVELSDADKVWRASQHNIDPSVEMRHLKVTNPNCHGKSLRELNARRRNQINISMVLRDGQTLLAEPELEIKLGDILSVVGEPREFETMRLLIGEEASAPLELDRSVTTVDVEVTETSLVGKTLSELKVFERYNVLILSVRRQGLEFVARGTTGLDIGDEVRVVGKAENIEAFVSAFNSRSHIVDETNMLPFLGGLLFGAVLGSVPISLPGQIEIRLGLAGGAFITGVVIGHFGRIGRVSMYVPQAAKNLCRELGLMLFLAAAGTFEGSGLLTSLLSNGLTIFLVGMLVSTLCVATTFILSHVVFKENILATLGFICGTMNNASGFGILRERVQSDLPALSYTTIYPVSLILKMILAQLFVVYSQLLIGK